MGFALRYFFAFLLVALTYNPTSFNYFAWAVHNFETQLPLVLLLGLVLLVGYIIYLRATFRSIGLGGIVLIAGLAASLLWVVWDYGFLSLANRSLNVWLGIFALAMVLGTGLSWSLIRRRLSGQLDVDDVDE